MAQINGMQPACGQFLREEGLSYNLADATEMSMGGKGCKVIVDGTKTDANAGQSFCALHCITACVLSAYTVRQYAPVTPTNVLNGITFPAGAVIYGQFTSITLASGTMIAYNGVNNAGA